MKKINVSDLDSKVTPFYSITDIFKVQDQFTDMKFGLVEIKPGMRVPEAGYSCHEEDEYSYFISGSLYSWNAGEASEVTAGEATLIPKGEEHYCINKGTEPCVIACVMLK